MTCLGSTAPARAAWLALGLLAALGCSDARQPPQPASFDRPTDVDFVCIVRGRPAELWRCDDERSADRALYALVTQSARGEVAAVNLETNRILDNRRDVPGYTFVPTGELPIAIVVSRAHPELTYVASYGSRDVHVMRTATLLGFSNEDAEAQPPISLTVGADGGAFGGTPTDMVMTPDGSALLVTLADVGKIARLPLGESGEIDEGGVTFVDLPVSSPAAPAPVPADEGYALLCGGFQRAPMPAIPPSRAPRAGPAARPVALAIDEACKRCDGPACRACGGGRVLVADEALPLLHVLDLDALADGGDPVLAPIPTGAPTRDVAVTPRVPSAFVADPSDGEPPNTYFVYAIDAVDGSVLVLENDALLAVNRDPGGRVDRLPITSENGAPAPVAIALEVITPRFRLTGSPAQYVEFFDAQEAVRNGVTDPGPGDLCLDESHTRITPRRLRGVFLTAALADGTVRVIDVHDMDLRRCRDCANAAGPAAVLMRHHPRIANDPIALEEGDRVEQRAAASAAVAVRTGIFNVRGNGSVASPLAPSLVCGPCSPGYAQALPDPKDQEAVGGGVMLDEDAGAGEANLEVCQQALVCGVDDPWAAPLAQYTFSYEAVVPNAGSGDGRFVAPGEAGNVSGVLELHSAVPFCARGVLGGDDVAGARDAAACVADDLTLSGDQVVILSELLSDRALAALGRTAQEREACGLVRAALDDDDTARLTFDVLAAFEDRLAVRSRLGAPFNSGPLSLDWPALRACLGDGLVAFEVRAKSGFLVLTATDGFRHNVIANERGRCVVDAMSGPKRSHRAWTGCRYEDERIQLTLSPFVRDENGVVSEPGDGYGALLSVGVTTTSFSLVMNASQIGFGVTSLVPARLRFSTANQHLYLVDTYVGGLIPIDLDPFTNTPITSIY